MNRQREIIYAERNKVLTGADVHEEIVKMIPAVTYEYVGSVIDYGKDYVLWDYDRINKDLEDRLLPPGSNVVTKELAASLNFDKVANTVAAAAINAYDEKETSYKDQGIPFGDFERTIMLRTVDKYWIEHIDAMDALRRGIGLRAVGQHDPVISYSNEGFEMFDAMIASIQRDTVFMALKMEIRKAEDRTRPKTMPIPEKPVKVGRNDPCPCGSGKKYKNCCGR